MAPLIKQLLEASLDGELDAHLDEEKAQGKKNRRNGRSSKKVKAEFGSFDLETGRDRQGTFEPKLVGKRQTTLGAGLDEQIISMYASGMSYSDIRSHLERLYGLEISQGTISAITDKILPLVEEWRSRPLEAVYPVVWMDAIVYKVRGETGIEKRAVYCVLGVDQYGQKDLLGLYLSENEGAKFWMEVLADLQHRGVEDIFVACIDNLSGFVEAVNGVFPNTAVKLCIVHQIRNSMKFLTDKDTKPFLADLKKVYQAPVGRGCTGQAGGEMGGALSGHHTGLAQ